MKLIVGLGNPEENYFQTRHNAGRLLVEQIAHRHSAKWKFKERLGAHTAEITWADQDVILAYPEVFMNVSGAVLASLVRRFRLQIGRDLLILVDDVAIPFGTFRLRGKGSSGGHNGLKSIEVFLETQNYARLRIGIGLGDPALKDPLETFVLSKFSAQEQKQLPSLWDRGEQACRLWVCESLQTAMSRVNA